MLAVRFTSDLPASIRIRDDVTVRRERSAAFMADLQGKPEQDMRRRLASGHRAYVAWRNGTPAAFGWVATRRAEIGELKTTLRLPARSRYLWNFVTLPAHRGLGIYSQLVDCIVKQESQFAHTFWIAYAPENHASARGVEKAGFRLVAAMSFDSHGNPAVRTIAPEVATDTSRLLSLPHVDASLTPCWKCVRAGRGAMACAPGACRCDYQRQEVACDSHSTTGNASSNGAGIS